VDVVQQEPAARGQLTEPAGGALLPFDPRTPRFGGALGVVQPLQPGDPFRSQPLGFAATLTQAEGPPS
jgi:hypothetical protein